MCLFYTIPLILCMVYNHNIDGNGKCQPLIAGSREPGLACMLGEVLDEYHNTSVDLDILGGPTNFAISILG